MRSTVLFAAKLPHPFRLPMGIAVEVEPKSGEGEIAWPKGLGQLGLEGFGDGCFDLVLDRDVQSGTMRILRGERAVEVLGDAFTDCQHGRAVKRERGALPQVHQPLKPCFGQRVLRCNCAKHRAQFLAQRGREGMEQRDVRVQVIALGRKVRATQTIRPGEQIGGQFGSDNERLRHVACDAPGDPACQAPIAAALFGAGMRENSR